MVFMKSFNKCMCDSLLDHWKKYSGQPLSNCCAVLDCVNRPEVGVLVRAVGSGDDDCYIIPLCKVHTKQRGKLLYLTKSVNLVSRKCRESEKEEDVLSCSIRQPGPCQLFTCDINLIEPKEVFWVPPNT